MENETNQNLTQSDIVSEKSKKPWSYLVLAVAVLAILGTVLYTKNQKSADNSETPNQADFKYPNEWGVLSLKETRDNGNHIYNSNNQAIKEIVYHKPSGYIAFVELGKKVKFAYSDYSDETQDIEYSQETFKLLSPDGDTKTLYAVSENDASFGGIIYDINFSPTGEYLAYGYAGYEFSEPRIIKLGSERDILEQQEIWYYKASESALWSADGKILMIRSYGGKGGGLEGIFVSDWGNPEKLNKTFVFSREEEWAGSTLANLNFSQETVTFTANFKKQDNRTYITTNKKITDYKFNAINKELAGTDWKTFEDSNTRIRLKYPSNWTVGRFENLPKQFTIQPTATFKEESNTEAVIISITGHCMNTQCLTVYNLDDMVKEFGAQKIMNVRSKTTDGYKVKLPDGKVAYMFIQGEDFVTVSSDAHAENAAIIAESLELLASQ